MTTTDTFVIFDDISLPQMRFLWDGYVRDKHVKEIYSLIVEDDPHIIGKYLK